MNNSQQAHISSHDRLQSFIASTLLIIGVRIFQILSSIKVRVFFEKNIGKRPLCCHDKNFYYFYKSNISVVNLVSGSRNMIKVSENMSFEKISSTMRVVFTKYRKFLAFFIVFEWGRILESAIDKWEVKCNVKLCPNYFSVNVSVPAAVFRRQFKKILGLCCIHIAKLVTHPAFYTLPFTLKLCHKPLAIL